MDGGVARKVTGAPTKSRAGAGACVWRAGGRFHQGGGGASLRRPRGRGGVSLVAPAGRESSPEGSACAAALGWGPAFPVWPGEGEGAGV